MHDSIIELEDEISKLIVDTLNLEDIRPEQIDRQAPLFGEGLGLDSIDALEVGAMISKRYGVKLKSQSEDTHVHFQSVASLAQFVLNFSQNADISSGE